MPLIEVANKLLTPLGGAAPLGTFFNPAVSARQLYDQGVRADGAYWIKGTGSTPYHIYCAMQAGGWMLFQSFRDPATSGWTFLKDYPTSTYSYGFTGTSAYLFNVPSAIESSCRYFAVNSDYDTAVPYQPTSENAFKFWMEYKDGSGNVLMPRLYQWITADKSKSNAYGMLSVSGTQSSYIQYSGNFKRYGTAFTSIYLGDDASRTPATRDESDCITFRNADGPNSVTYTAASDAYAKHGWGAVDSSGETSGAVSSWGTSGRDGASSTPKQQDRLFAWIR